MSIDSILIEQQARQAKILEAERLRQLATAAKDKKVNAKKLLKNADKKMGVQG